MQSEKKSEKGLFFFLTVRCFACVFVCVLLVCRARGVRLDYPGPGVTDGFVSCVGVGVLWKSNQCFYH